MNPLEELVSAAKECLSIAEAWSISHDDSIMKSLEAALASIERAEVETRWGVERFQNGKWVRWSDSENRDMAEDIHGMQVINDITSRIVQITTIRSVVE